MDNSKEWEMKRQYLELQVWERMSPGQRNRWWEMARANRQQAESVEMRPQHPPKKDE